MPHLETSPDASRRRSGQTGPALTGGAPTGDALVEGDKLDRDPADDDLAGDGPAGDDLRDDGVLAGWRRRDDEDPARPTGGRGRREPPWPLRRAVPPAAPFPLEALGPDLAAAARAIQARTLAPLALCGQAVLGAAALAAQAQADVLLPDGRRCPLSLALLSVASPGERLGMVADDALRAVRDAERRLRSAWAGARESFEIDRAAWRHARRGARAHGRAARRASLEAAGPAPVPPRTPALLTCAPSLHGLLTLLADGQASMGLVDAEGATVIAGGSRAAGRRMAGALARLWHDGSAERPRPRDGVVNLSGKRLSLHVAAAPGEDLAGLVAPDAAGRRLFSRLLCVAPASTIGTRLLSDASDAIVRATRPDLDRFDTRIAALLGAAPPAAELAPRPLPMAPDAASRWRAFGNEVETAIAAGGDLEIAGALAGTAAEQVGRIAGVLTVYGDAAAPAIEDGAIAGAIALMRHYLGEADRIAGLADETAGLRRARAVLNHIMGWGRPVVHLSEIYQTGPRATRDAAAARAAMRLLDDHGYVERLWDGAKIDGLHRREAWRLIAAMPASPSAKVAKVAAPPASAVAGPTRPLSDPAIPAAAPWAGCPGGVAELAKVAKVAAPPASAVAGLIHPLSDPAIPAAAPWAERPGGAAELAKVAKVVAPPASAAAGPTLPLSQPARPAAAPWAERPGGVAELAKVAKVAAPPTSAADGPTLPLSQPARPAAAAWAERPGGAAELAKVAKVVAPPASAAAGPTHRLSQPALPAAAAPWAGRPGGAAELAKVANVVAPPASAGSVAHAAARRLAGAPEGVADSVAPSPPPPPPPGTHDRPDGTEPAARPGAEAVPPEWAAGVARLDRAPPPPGFTSGQWAGFVDSSARLLEVHGGALHRMGWTAREIFGLDPRAPGFRPDAGGLALHLAATPRLSIAGIGRDSVRCDTASGKRRRFWKIRAARGGVAAWLIAPPGRGQDGGARP